MSDRILKLPEVIERVGLSKWTIYRRIQGKTFPEAVPLGGGSVGWLESEIQAWIEERKRERDAQCADRWKPTAAQGTGAGS